MSTLTTRLDGHRVVITDYLILDEIPVRMAEIPDHRWLVYGTHGRVATSRPWPIRLELAYRSQALGRLLTTVVTDLEAQGLWSE